MLLFRKDKLSIVVRCNRQNSVIELQHMTPYMNEYHTNIHSYRKDCAGSRGSNVTVGRAIHREMVAVN